MCEVVVNLVTNESYSTPRQMLDAGIAILDEDIFGMDETDENGLVHGYTMAGTGEPCPPFSPYDSCLCGVDTEAALNRTPGLEWRRDEYMGEPEITAWTK